MPSSLGSQIFVETVRAEFANRIRRRDLRIIVVLGVAYWAANHVGFCFMQGIPAFDGLGTGCQIGWTFGDITRVVVGSVVGIAQVAVFALLQFDDRKAPRVLTLKAAFYPPFLLLLTFVAGSPFIIERTGSLSYAVATIAVFVVNALWVSLLMFRLRK